jgi:hypothetical protein
MGLSLDIQAKGFATALNLLAPGNAVVTEKKGGYVVKPDASQARYLREMLDRKIDLTPSSAPGNPKTAPGVKLDLSDVYVPIVLKKSIPLVFLLLGAGYLLGKAL